MWGPGRPPLARRGSPAIAFGMDHRALRKEGFQQPFPSSLDSTLPQAALRARPLSLIQKVSFSAG